MDPSQARTVTAPALAPGEIHVWRLDLAGELPVQAQARLHASEWERALRFAFDRDRNRHVRARLALRALLASYLRVSPGEIAIHLDGHGKPGIDASHGLGFNLSHAGDLGLVAIGRAAHIGVDIEEMLPRSDMRALAASLFTPGEQAALAGVDDAALTGPFLACWTRKEAFLKALGLGLAREPASVEVGIEADRRQVPVAGLPGATSVEVATILIDAHCVAALAVAGGFGQARLMQWPP
jgi:4'-phosphopantetheinyl transferase